MPRRTGGPLGPGRKIRVPDADLHMGIRSLPRHIGGLPGTKRRTFWNGPTNRPTKPDMNQLRDQHLHSKLSFDSKAEPEENLHAAMSRGLGGLCFTEHYDTHPRDWPGCVFDDHALSETVRRLRTDAGDEVFVGKGIEVCFQPPTMDRILKTLERGEFDIVLLSVHYSGDRPLHKRASWDGKNPAEIIETYFRGVLDALTFCQAHHAKHGPTFHVFTHLDLVKRYATRFLGAYDDAPFASLLDEIAAGLVASGVVPEVNTSTWRQGCDEPMPGTDFIARYARAGGTAMSIGSDAHKSNDIGADFDRAIECMRAGGIENFAAFEGGVRRDVPLPKYDRMGATASESARSPKDRTG